VKEEEKTHTQDQINVEGENGRTALCLALLSLNLDFVAFVLPIRMISGVSE
jgi:hypothetical protein